MPRTDLKISVCNADVLDFPCSVLVLKYAQAWHGADLAVSSELGIGRSWDQFLEPGEFKLIDTAQKLPASFVLFEGVAELGQLNYSRIRSFGRNAILHVNEVASHAKHVAMTIHGVHIGMDERECFLSQLAGVVETLSRKNILPHLEELSFVEKNAARAKRLTKLLSENYQPAKKVEARIELSPPLQSAGSSETEKPHIFVAMPFSPDMEDVFIFGIQGPVQEAGYLCERVDMDTFTGDIVERIKSRIETAKLVVADLTHSNANVYLEVGYAWGRNVRALLLCRNIEELKFDVKGQRCIVYSSINDLKKKLTQELAIHLR